MNSFKERMRLEIILGAKTYAEVFVAYEYLICSEAYRSKPYYIIDAKEDNFLHLTGVSTRLSARAFYEKCLSGDLKEDDFCFEKKGQHEKAVKSTVKRKMQVLPKMMQLFQDGVETEEPFKRNKISCSFATADKICTLGFSDSKKVRPKSLIKGNALNSAHPVDLILRKRSGEELFDEVVVGNEKMIRKYWKEIKHLVDDKLVSHCERG